MRSDYEILGISRDADQNEIKKAYFRQLRKHTPETDPEGFKEIRAAYERLKTEKREDDAPVFPPLKDDLQIRFLEQIDKCMATCNYKFGMETALEACRLYPDTQVFLYRLGELQCKCGNTGKAVKTAEKLIRLDPGNRWYHRALGMACRERGYHKKAYDAFYRAYELGCRDPVFIDAFVKTAYDNDMDSFAMKLMLEFVRSKTVWRPEDLPSAANLFDHLVFMYCREKTRYPEVPGLYLDFMETYMKQMVNSKDVFNVNPLTYLAMHSLDNEPVLTRCRNVIRDLNRMNLDTETKDRLKNVEENIEFGLFDQDERLDENLRRLFFCLEDDTIEARNYALLDDRLCLIESCTDPQGQKDILRDEYPQQYEVLAPYLDEMLKGPQALAQLKTKLQKTYANYSQYCSGGRYFDLYPEEKDRVLGQVIATGEKPYIREHKKIGRNDPCPCGSGKKFKQCCMNR